MPISPSISHIEKLKKELLIIAGLTTVRASDCKALSLMIKHITGGSVSETTMKRVYGFAISRFLPSIYTLNQMALCCGYGSWEDFSHSQSATLSSADDREWQKIRKDAEKITEFTIRALQNKSGIPYSYTIARKFISENIDNFSFSGSVCALLTAPYGYGKTIGLCNWAEEKMENISAGHSNDILLFFSTDAMLSALLTGRDINDWLFYLLGIGDHGDSGILLKQARDASQQFYLVIDGLDEFVVKSELFKTLTEQVKLLLSTYNDHPWFRIILSMRTSGWINSRHLIEPDNMAIDPILALPLFDREEIARLAERLNPEASQGINAVDLEYLSHPIFFQYYYKLHKDDFKLNYTGHLLAYELVYSFIQHKILLGPNAEEKLFLLHRLVLEIDLHSDNFTVDKLKLSPVLKHYHQAYWELLGIGFITEFHDHTHYHTSISFGNQHFLEYAIAKAYLAENDEQFDLNLVGLINATLTGNPHKTEILKWCLLSTLKSGQQVSDELLTRVQLSPNEIAEMDLFLVELPASRILADN